MLFDKMTWKEIEEKQKKIKTVIVPISPLEEHGPHLPVSTDYLTAYEIAKRAAEKTGVFVLPPIIVGVVNHGYLYPGTVSIKPETFENVVFDMCKSLSDTGFKKIIFFTGHWGIKHSEALKNGVNRFESENKKANVIFTQTSLLEGETTKKVIETQNDRHAGEFETSRILELAEKEVRRGKEVKEFPNYVDDVTPEFVRKVNKSGVYGDATKATKEKGKILIDAAVESLVKLVRSD